MAKTINLTFYVSTGYVGSKRSEEVEVEVPDDYDIDLDPDKIIQEEFTEWLWNSIEAGWYENN